MEVIEGVKELIAPYLEDNGIELVEITYRREQPGMVLRLLVDTPTGITVDECEALNNYLSDLLDEQSIISEHYLLEVSSPGLDRPLRTTRDFERSIGKILGVSTFEPIDGKRSHEGTLVGMDKENIVIEKEGVSTVIPIKKIALARLKIEF